MPTPLSRRRFERLCRILPRVHAILAMLDAVKDRKAPLPPAFAGPARRTLDEAGHLLGLTVRAPARSNSPDDLFVGTCATMEALNYRLSGAKRARGEKRWKNYPRGVPLA